MEKRKNVDEGNPINKNVEVISPIKWQHNDQSMTEVN